MEIVVEDGFTGDGLMAMFVAFLDDRPPYCRYNAELMSAKDAEAWARGQLDAGCVVSMKRAGESA